MMKKAQVAEVDMLAAASLFSLLIVGAVYTLHNSTAAVGAYASEARNAIYTGAQLQKVAYLISVFNVSPPATNSVAVTRLYVSAADRVHPYNGSRLIVLNGSIYILNYS